MNAENILQSSQASSQFPMDKTSGFRGGSAITQVNGSASLGQEKPTASYDKERKKQRYTRRRRCFHSDFSFGKYRKLTKQNILKLEEKSLDTVNYDATNCISNNIQVLTNKENIPANSCSLNDYGYKKSNNGENDMQYCKTILNTELESDIKENVNLIHDMEKSVKKTDCQIYENIEENSTKIEISDSPKNRILIPSKQLSSNEIFVNDNDEQEVDINNLISNTQFTVITQTSSDNCKYELNKNLDTTGGNFVPQIIVPESIEPIYDKQHSESTVGTFEQFHHVPSTSVTIDQNVKEIDEINSAATIIELVLSLKQDIQELKKKFEKQENILNTVVNATTMDLTPLFVQSFQEKYSLNVPFTRIDEFHKFNLDLAKHTSYCNEFITSLCSYIDNNVSLAKNILTMIRSYMSKDLINLHTATKPTGNKMVLKDTLFCKCLLQATKLTIRNGLLPLEHEKAFMKSLSVVVSGAKSWSNNDEENKKFKDSYNTN